MRGGAWGLTRELLVAVTCAALLSACSAHTAGLSEEFKTRLAEIRDHAGKALQEGLEKQAIAPGEESLSQRQRQPKMLQAGEPIWIQSGKSRVLQLPNPVRRVSIADPELAGIVVLGPRAIMVNAKELPPPPPGQAQRGVQVSESGIFLGRTITPEPRMAETTLVLWGAADEIDVHTVVIADFINQQVMLEVIVADVNRTALEQHGLDFRVVQDDFIAAGFLGGGAIPGISELITVPPQVNEPLLPLQVGPLGPQYAFIFPNEDVTAFVRALQTEGLASILAQPHILAMSGQTALIQVGGEIPIRISSGFAADIEFKPFGVIVNFVPRVSEEGNIMLTVTPEVSEADFINTVEDIPTFRTRRASTTASLRNGETLVIGGLLQTTTLEEVSGVPYAKDIPIIGYVFRQSFFRSEIRELMVIVKPTLARPMAPGTFLTLPTERGPLTNEEIRTKPEDNDAARPRIPGLP